MVESEIDQLLERNFELRRKINLVEGEIAELKQSLSLSQDRLVQGIEEDHRQETVRSPTLRKHCDTTVAP